MSICQNNSFRNFILFHLITKYLGQFQVDILFYFENRGQKSQPRIPKSVFGIGNRFKIYEILQTKLQFSPKNKFFFTGPLFCPIFSI